MSITRNKPTNKTIAKLSGYTLRQLHIMYKEYLQSVKKDIPTINSTAESIQSSFLYRKFQISSVANFENCIHELKDLLKHKLRENRLSFLTKLSILEIEEAEKIFGKELYDSSLIGESEKSISLPFSIAKTSVSSEKLLTITVAELQNEFKNYCITHEVGPIQDVSDLQVLFVKEIYGIGSITTYNTMILKLKKLFIEKEEKIKKYVSKFDKDRFTVLGLLQRLSEKEVEAILGKEAYSAKLLMDLAARGELISLSENINTADIDISILLDLDNEKFEAASVKASTFEEETSDLVTNEEILEGLRELAEYQIKEGLLPMEFLDHPKTPPLSPLSNFSSSFNFLTPIRVADAQKEPELFDQNESKKQKKI